MSRRAALKANSVARSAQGTPVNRQVVWTAMQARQHAGWPHDLYKARGALTLTLCADCVDYWTSSNPSSISV